MISHPFRSRALAIALSALAGFVDAIGFITVGGFFVSFMSGNSTRLGVGLVSGSSDWFLAAALISGFVLGVTSGSLAGRQAREYRRPAVLALVAVLLAVAAAGHQSGVIWLSVAAMVLAMGDENAVFEADAEAHIGLTYMTGTLVKIGQRVAAALTGGDRWAWVPYLLLWTGLLAGAIGGTALYMLMGGGALWIATLAASLLAIVSIKQ